MLWSGKAWTGKTGVALGQSRVLMYVANVVLAGRLSAGICTFGKGLRLSPSRSDACEAGKNPMAKGEGRDACAPVGAVSHCKSGINCHLRAIMAVIARNGISWPAFQCMVDIGP